MSAGGHKRRAEGIRASCAVITTSDTRTEKTDESGRVARELLEKAGHQVAARDLVPNREGTIRAAIRRRLREGCDFVLVTGGTGAGPRDVSIQAAQALFDRELPGFGEIFRFLSWEEVGSAAMLSRAALGLVKGRAVCVTPGSPKAVRLALEKLLIPELAHLLSQARGR
ncbi:MAG: molybdenum cofactor biosynthesis protein MoaB [Planctomycetes bacterium]|nr:molybdenum cofactor biosynthesis protein MoaB [Planctomycetota bacterium]